MKNLSLTFCLAIAALFGSVGSGFAIDLPRCSRTASYWHNCFNFWMNGKGYSYVGEFRNNKQHGTGIAKFPNLDHYHGDFKRGKMNGKGYLGHFTGNKYVGEFKNDKKHGIGTFTWTSGDKYVGEFRNGLINGEGIYTFANGIIKEGVWKSEKFQNAKKTPYSKKSFLLQILPQNAFIQLDSHERRQIQTKLKNLGYYKSSIDGIYGKGTATALNLYNEMHLSKSDLSRDKNIEQLINSVLGIKPVPKSKKVIVEKTPNNAIAQNKNDLPLVVLKLGVVPPFKCAFVISGEINHELYKSFEKSLQENRNPSDCRKSDAGFASSNLIKTVILRTSRGGDLNAAFNIMKLIRRHNLVTQIDSDLTDFCLSSCALIFASGTQRHWTMNNDLGNPKLVLGIHKPDLVEGTYDFLKREKILDELKYEIIDFLAKGGVDARFSIKMFETSNENMMFPKMQDLLVWRTVTELEDPQYFKNLKLRSGYSDKVFAKPIAGQNNFGRPFAYHGWLLKNQSMENSKDYQTVSTALREVNQLLNFQIVDD